MAACGRIRRLYPVSCLLSPDQGMPEGGVMRYEKLWIILGLASVAAWGGQAWPFTAAMKSSCANCHTMHNSQGGAPVGGNASLTDAKPALLNNSCYGCHTGDNTTGSMPYVMSLSGAPNYDGSAGAGLGTGTETGHNTLAGGSFYWVSQGQDNSGHNVEGLATQTTRTPPGGSTSFTTLTCAGTTGCHGNPAIANGVMSIQGGHHNNNITTLDGLTIASSYRFLSGITGIEDDDWELTVSSTDHNQYKGTARTSDADTTDTISHLCARCHGTFHNGTGSDGVADATFASPWVRHPVDIDMNGLSEVAGYGGVNHDYDVTAPVASDDMTQGVQATVFDNANDAIITCLSCHRAHGSPYAASLRWDYASWPGGGYYGCGQCHTNKN